MLIDPKSREVTVNRALEEAKKVLTEYQVVQANTSTQVNLVEQYGQEPERFTD